MERSQTETLVRLSNRSEAFKTRTEHHVSVPQFVLEHATNSGESYEAALRLSPFDRPYSGAGQNHNLSYSRPSLA